MSVFTSRIGALLALLLYGGSVGATSTSAQSIIPAPNDTNTLVNQNGNQIDISGGTLSSNGSNLFHSFTQFGLNQNEIGNFLSNPSIQNILGRVNGGNASVINGLIQVTGGNSNLFLMNPAGIIFGAGASLNVPASFTATTANGIGFGSNWFSATGANDYNALVGTPNGFAFAMSQPGAIANAGNLAVNAGQNLTLLGGTVVSTGQLSAPGGNITVAAVPGESVVRISQAGSLLSVEIQPLAAAGNQPNDWKLPIASLPQLLTGAGDVGATKMTVAADGTVYLTGSGTAIPTDTGTVIASGSLNTSNTAPGQTGGTVQIVGNKVGLVGANINASGTLGGGTVRIGGDYQGKGTLPNASRTYVSSDSLIAADALLNGNGGKVIVWADETTRFYGNITARGGTQGGNGGFVEVSGKQNLDFDGLVDVGAPLGKGGQLLLDPKSVVIDTADDDNNQLDDKTILADDGKDNDTFKISAGKVKTMLNSGNVSIAATENIDVKSAINASSNTNTYNLALDAATVNLNAPIKLKGGLTINSTQLLKIDANANLNLGGAFNQTGSGTVSIGSDITTSKDEISFKSAVTLTGNVKLDTGTGGGDIFTGAITGGGKNLELVAGTGNIKLDGAVGSDTPIGNLTFTSATNIDTKAIVAASVTQKAGTGTTTFDGALKTSSEGGIQLTTNTIDFKNKPVDAGAKPIVLTADTIKLGSSTIKGSDVILRPKKATTKIGIDNTDQNLNFTATQLNNITADNLIVGVSTNTGGIAIGTNGSTLFQNKNLTFITGGQITLNGDITNNKNIHFNGDVTLAKDIKLNTGTGNGDIIFSQAIAGGGKALELSAGTGNIKLDGAVGSSTKPLGKLTINNSGTLTIAADIELNAAFEQTGNSSVSLSGDITTSNDNISFSSPVTLKGDVKLDTGTGSGDITFSGAIIGGGKDLELSAGTGTIKLGSTTGLDALIIDSAGDVTSGAITATSITQTLGTGTTSFKGALNTSGGSGIKLTANEIKFGSTVDAKANPIVLTADKFDLGLSTIAGSEVTLAPKSSGQSIGVGISVEGINFTLDQLKNITASNLIIGDATNTTSIQIGTLLNPLTENLTFISKGTVDVTAPLSLPLSVIKNLTITNGGKLTIAPNADINLGGAFVQNGSGSVVTASNITAENGINFKSAVTLTGADIAFKTGTGTGNITFNNTLNGTNPSGQNLTLEAGKGTIQFNNAVGNSISLGNLKIDSGNVNANAAINVTSLTQNAGSGTYSAITASDIQLTGNIFNLKGAINTTSGGITINNSGKLTIAPDADMNLGEAFLQTGLGTVSTAGNIQAETGISFSGNVTLTGNIKLDTGTGSGDIAFTGEIAGSGKNMELSAGTGNIKLDGAVGSSDTPIGNLTFTSAKDVDTKAITAASITQTAGTGTTTFNGELKTNTATGINLSGTEFIFNSPVTTTSNGTVTINNSGNLTIAANADMNLAGGFSQTGTGAVSTAGDITTSNDKISFSSPVTLTGLLKLDTGTGGGDIFTGAITGDGKDLELSAGTGNITLSNASGLGNFKIHSASNVQAGAISATSITQGAVTPTTGTTTYSTLNAAGDINLKGSIFKLNGAINTTGGGVTINNSGQLTIAPATDMTLVGAFLQNGTGKVSTGGNITASGIKFNQGVSLSEDVNFDTSASNGAIAFNSTVDGQKILTVNAGSGDITFSSTVNTASLATATTGVGGTTKLNGNVTTANSQIYGNNVLLTGDIILKGDAIDFKGGADSVVGTGSLTLQTATPKTAIAIGFDKDASHLNINDTDLAALKDGFSSITIGNASEGQNIVVDSATFKDAVTIQAGKGTLTVQGTSPGITTNASIHLIGGATTLNSGIDTTDGGNLTLTNSDVLTIASGVKMDLSGAFVQNGTGSVSTAGNITASSIQFNQGVNLTGSISLETSAGDISFGNTLNGNHDLTLTAGTGNINFTDAVGGSNKLGSVTINSAQNVQAAAITAASLTQNAGSGTTTFNGALNTNSASGIHLNLNGNNFAFKNPVTTTNNGGVSINNTGTLTIDAAADMNLDGAFSQGGTGGVITAGDITTTNDTISFSGAVNLTGAVSLNTGAGVGDISFSNTVNGTQNLNLAAGTGNVIFNNWVGKSAALSNLTVSNAALVAFKSTANLTGNLNLTAAEINFDGGDNTIVGGGTVQLQPAKPDQAIAIGGFEETPALDITQKDINALGGFKPIIIGSDSGTGKIDVNAVTFDDPVKIQSPNGIINVNGTIQGVDDAAIALNGATTNLGANITTNGQNISLGQLGKTVWLTTDIALASGGGDIIFEGNVSAQLKNQQGLTLNPGAGQAIFKGNVGSPNLLEYLTINNDLGVVIIGGENATLKGNSADVYQQLTVNAKQTLLSGIITTLDGNIIFNGDVTLTDDTFLNTGFLGAGNISFNGTLDSEKGEYNDLKMIAGTGNIFFGKTVGAGDGKGLGAILIENATDVTAISTIVADSLTQLSGSTTTLAGDITTTKPAGVNITANNIQVGGSLNTNGGKVNLTGNGGVSASNITSKGGEISLNSTQGAIASNGTLDSSGGKVNLTANQGVTAANITSKGGEIALNSSQGAIASNGTLDSSGGKVNLTANQGVTASNITSKGGEIALNSTQGAIASNGILDSSGGNVSLNGNGGVSASNITSKGGEIALNSTQGAIASNGTLDSSGGKVNLTANQKITTNNITSKGGGISLTSDTGAINTAALDSSSATGAGGAIALNSKQGAIQTGSLISKGDTDAGGITVIANDSITTLDLDATATKGAGNAIALTSQNGTVQTGNVKTSGSPITVSAQDNITAANIDSASEKGTGGAIALTSQKGAITAANVTSKGTTGGGAVTVAAPGSITTANIDTSSTNGTGGAIRLTAIAPLHALLSDAAAIQSGNLLSQGTAGGGDIEVSAQGIITAGVIDSSSSFGKGGNVTLANPLIELNKKPMDDIQVVSINAQSGGSAFGGVVKITTDRFFRATGTFTDSKNPFATSISTIGGAGDGAIMISHGGGSSFTPFVVGDATENGTAGALTTGTGFLSTILPSKEFPGPYRQGNIQITPRRPGDNLLPYFGAMPLNTPTSVSDVTVDTTSDLDSTITSKFDQHLGQTGNITNPKAAANLLSQIEKQTSIKSAFVYAVFAPDQVSSSQKTQINKDDERLELILVTGEGKTKRVRVAGSKRGALGASASRSQILKVAGKLRNAITNKNKLNDDYRAPAEQLYQWLIAPIKDELEAQGIQNLVFIMDAGLRSLPIAALHDGQQFLIEKYSIGLMPSLSLTDTRYANLKNAKVLAMGADRFTNKTQNPLPAVPVELSMITSKLWQGKSFLNEAFTLKNLKAQRTSTPYEIIHLATHAEFKSGALGNSYIQLWDTQLRLDQVRQLGWNKPAVELLVLSACRSALGNEEAELGFAGFAVQAGVKSALASLWYVSDEGTLGLMTDFYKELKKAPIKAEALRQAQLAMLKGKVRLEGGKLHTSDGNMPLPSSLASIGDKDLKHPYFWSAFTMIGSPW
ncbi:CHAT domain-containing protein [Coleofasciculus sp. FACHB-SPT36]|uniref:CHAT domain-containing protein n=2 Tax=Cyanophyceae TaxID=3028117 RepID=UPI00168B8E9D|nr:CHAT domain-containing protein [Coleofasciculus sp. FACHB-SPT36]MBD2537811.1 CHAT domain-containing protein [Coleofasciculus sp. FACHB-SPT36]